MVMYVCVQHITRMWVGHWQWHAHHSVHTDIHLHTPRQTPFFMLCMLNITSSLQPPNTQSNGMRNNISSLPSIYSHQKLEPLLCCNNHCCCLEWMPSLLYTLQSGAVRASSLFTPKDKMHHDLWPWPRHLIASVSAVPLSGNEAHSRNPIRSTLCALKFSS